MEKFDLFIPSGTSCVTSFNLRNAKLQEEALPFDWIAFFMTRLDIQVAQQKSENLDWLGWQTLDLIADNLSTNFENFLNLDQLVLVEKGETECTYKMPSGMIFPHDFKEADPSLEFKKVYDKYQRRIKRLQKKIHKAKRVLFVLSTLGEPDADKLMEVYDRLKRLYPKKYLKILYIHIIRGKKGYDCVYQSPELDIVEMEFGTDFNKVNDWQGNPAVFREFFSNYGLSQCRMCLKQLKQKVRELGMWMNKARPLWKRKAIKLLCCFVPSKEIRQKLRDKYKGNSF